MRASPPDRLLALLTDSLRENGFHLRPLLRGIALSRTYQRSVGLPALYVEALARVPSLIEQLTALRPQQ